MLPAWLSLQQEGSLQIKGQKTTETHPKDPPCNTKLISNISISTSLRGRFSSVSFSLFLRRSLWSALFKSSKTRRCENNNVKFKKCAVTPVQIFGRPDCLPNLSSLWLPTSFSMRVLSCVEAPDTHCGTVKVRADSGSREDEIHSILVNILICPAGKSSLKINSQET